MIETLSIQNFRGLQNVTLPKVGRINLITGKNNAGKSSLLEAIELLNSSLTSNAFAKILGEREEIALRADRMGRNVNVNVSAEQLRHLCFGHPNLANPLDWPEVKLRSNNDSVRIAVDLFTTRLVTIVDEEGDPVEVEQIQPYDPKTKKQLVLEDLPEDVEPRLVIERNGRQLARIRLDQALRPRPQLVPDKGPTLRILSLGLDTRTIVSLWDEISLTTKETSLNEMLKLISPDLERINFLGDDESGNRVGKALLTNDIEPVSLRSLGDGTQRLLGVTLAMLSTQNGIVLIDEIETGIHHSILMRIWRSIFALSKEYNVQVFATTHSLECIKAFSQAASADPELGMLFRLNTSDSREPITLFTEEELKLATEYDVEVR